MFVGLFRMDNEMEDSSTQESKIVQYDGWNNAPYSDDTSSIQEQLVISYLLVKLCKERGLSVNCFHYIVTKLYCC